MSQENITSVGAIRARTVQEGFTPDVDDVILADHGTGSNRHRAFTIGEIGELISGGGITELHLHKTGPGSSVVKKMDLDGESMKFSNEGQGASDFTESEIRRDSMKVSVTSQGYDTFAEVKKTGLEVSYGPTEGDKTLSKVEYDKVTTPKLKANEIEGTKGAGAAGVYKVEVTTILEAKQNVVVDGNTTMKDDVSVGMAGSGNGADLNVYGTTTTDTLVVGPSNTPSVVAGAGAPLAVNIPLNATSNLALPGATIDCSSDTQDVDVVAKIAATANLLDCGVFIFYCKNQKLILNGNYLITGGFVALPFFRLNSTRIVPMFLAEWTQVANS